MFMSLSVLFLHMSAVPQRPREGMRSPGLGVPGDCGPPDMGAGNQTQVLYKNNKHLTDEDAFLPHSVVPFIVIYHCSYTVKAETPGGLPFPFSFFLLPFLLSLFTT